jgi:Pol polyprotein
MFLLDSAATEHICNDKSRLTNYRVAKPGEHVIAGERKVPISGYGTMTVHCKPANGKKESRIARNAHYIPSGPFIPYTNLISYDKAMEQGIYWDRKKGILTKNDKPKCYVFRHCVIDNGF